MKRLVLFVAVQILTGAAWAQSQKNPVQVSFDASPCGHFYVDGQFYDKAASFSWPLYSMHTYRAVSYPVASDTLCQANGGDPNNLVQNQSAVDHQVTVFDTYISDAATRPPTCTFLPGLPECQSGTRVIPYSGGSATVPISSVLWHKVSAVVAPNSGASSCTGVSINGTSFNANGSIWVAAGSTLNISAFACNGLAFKEWTGAAQAYGSGPTIAIPNLSGPIVITPVFAASPQVIISSDPPGFKVMADNTILDTPTANLYWAPGSVHTLSPVVPQYRSGTNDLWGFLAWSDGGDENRAFTVPDTRDPIRLTVKYAPGAKVNFSTVPQGLKLVIDGQPTLSYNFVWAFGSKHRIAAPLDQTMNGRSFSFKAWSIGGAPEQDFVTPSTGPQQAIVASYDTLGQLQIQSAPPGVTMTVDGAACVTPCTVDRKAGTAVKFSAPASAPVAEGTRLDFNGWADGGAAERTWTAGTDAQVVTANYQTSYLVAGTAEPAGGATFKFEPPSPDGSGYFPANSDVKVTAEGSPGYKFKSWQGQWASPLSATQIIHVTGPMKLSVLTEVAPYIAVNGVRNAAGVTPEAIVAPGSLIKITGANLAPLFEKGPDSPLAQSISGVWVQVMDRLLPLVSVSPSEITAQLFSDLGLADDYELVVHQESQPDVKTTFAVKRNAPGLFANTVDSKQFALAMHDDGTPVATDKPAAHGETITLLGTGFGPYQSATPDGFVLPAAFPTVKLVDPVEIRVGETTVLQPESVTAAKGYLGTTAIRLKITDDLPANTTIELRAAMKDQSDPEGKKYHESNKVLLPVK